MEREEGRGERERERERGGGGGGGGGELKPNIYTVVDTVNHELRV